MFYNISKNNHMLKFSPKTRNISDKTQNNWTLDQNLIKTNLQLLIDMAINNCI